MGEVAIPVLLATSAAVSTAGAITSAIGQAKMADFNARVAEQDAAAARQQGEAEAARRRRAAARALGQRRAAFGAAGVTVDGSPLDLLEDLAAEHEVEALDIRRRAMLRARELRIGAERSRYQAGVALEQGAFGAATKALDGSLSTLRNLPKPTQKKFEPIPFRGFNLEDARPAPGDPV